MLSALADSVPGFSYAMQRFDTMTDILKKICIYISPIKNFLTNTAAGRAKSAAWAISVLQAGCCVCALGLLSERSGAGSGRVERYPASLDGRIRRHSAALRP